ncbi:hypothetical protein D3Z47_02270 [Lachnospiraceae bacterium]|nr:hypothetical protein [Lachnospiraceae bacterium]
MENNLPITFETLRVRYGTGRSYLIRTEGRHKVHGYRKGVMTGLGDLELKEWKRLAMELVQTSQEQQLYQNLLEWRLEHNCRRSDSEPEIDALELHMSRIFDDPLWVGYIPFNRRYRPEILDSSRLVWVKTECCGEPGEVTKERLEYEDGRIPCPVCGRWSAFEPAQMTKNKQKEVMWMDKLAVVVEDGMVREVYEPYPGQFDVEVLDLDTTDPEEERVIQERLQIIQQHLMRIY